MYYMEDGTRTESRSARAWLEKHPEIIKLFLHSQENQLNGNHMYFNKYRYVLVCFSRKQ